jgi:dihydrofolate synthase/folylpolyglutamate synthase
LIDSRYQQALDYLYSFIDYETMHQPRDAAGYDLRRMESLLRRLGNPHLKVNTVHIAGTKGKGSVAAMIASVLKASGYTTGLYTSPHLIDIKERFRVDGRMIAEDELVELVDRILPEVSEVNRLAEYGRLTTFELLTALALCFFEQRNVQFQVIEVGLGGRLDATNVICPEVCVITAIGLDHTEVLGETLAQVTREKAGIIKQGIPVVSSPQTDEVIEMIRRICQHKGAPLVVVGDDVKWQGLGFKKGGQHLTIEGTRDSYQIVIPLIGSYQLGNATTAVAALEFLAGKGFSISRRGITEGLESVSWPGRFQVVGSKPTVLLDGAHNPTSADALVSSMGSYFGQDWQERFNPSVLVLGVSIDKDAIGILSVLRDSFKKIVVTSSRHPRAMVTEDLEAELKKHGLSVEAIDKVPEAVSKAKQLAGEDGLVLVTGSIFVVGEAIEVLDRRQSR